MTLVSAVLSFAVLAGLLTVIPGLDTALVLRSALTQGKRPAFATALGITVGTLLWGAAAAVGVSALLLASTAAYTALRVVGAAYMVFLGGRMLWTALRRRATVGAAPVPDDVSAPSIWRAWTRGLLTNLLNPKIGAFYVAVLPQFIPAGTSHLAVGVLLALVHDVEGMLWFTAVIFGAASIRAWLLRRSAQRAVDGTTGVALIGFGVKLGLSAR
ncbi:MAG TPA: LysE family translocator [Jatrophihabitantaceae bacterium]|jgi:threonine/homoserine/homoserine lactone efflux protein